MNKGKTVRILLLVITAMSIVLSACSAPAAETEPQAAVDSSSACAVFDSIPAAEEYSAAPELLIDTAGKYFANFKMANGGEFKIELYADKAPITVTLLSSKS